MMNEAKSVMFGYRTLVACSRTLRPDLGCASVLLSAEWSQMGA